MSNIDPQLRIRMREALDHLGCDKNKSLFAEKVGVSSQAISKIYRGISMPTLRMMAKIAMAFPNTINWHWILTGKGSLIPKVTTLSNNEPDQENINNNIISTQAHYLNIITEKDNKIIDQDDKINKLNEKIITILESQIKNMQQ